MKALARTERGFALLLVVSVIGVVAVMGLALLSGSALQTASSRNLSKVAAVDALAESGVELATYYLAYPTKAPRLVNGFWPGATGLTLGTGVAGTFDVSITSQGSNIYTITATGRTGSSGEEITRTIVSQVLVISGAGFTLKHCAVFNAPSVTLKAGSTISQNIQVNGELVNYGDVDGKVYSSSLRSYYPGTVGGGWEQLTGTNRADIPLEENLRSYLTYAYNGQTYSAVPLPSSLSWGSTYGPTASNPAGIYYYNGPELTVSGEVRITGTLLVPQGDLTVNGDDIEVSPLTGYPAAIIHGDVYLQGRKNRSVELNGLVWLGGSLTSSKKNTDGGLVVNGALLCQGGINSNFGGRLNVTYDATKAGGVDLDVTKDKASVKVLSFQR